MTPMRRVRTPAPPRAVRIVRLLGAVTLALACAVARAETLYVVDRIEIGVHETTELDSVILEVVPTGTPLTVLERSGEFVQVRTPDGNEGWVDESYLVSSEPARQSVTELQQRLSETARDLGAARAEVEVLRQRLADARQVGGGSTSEASADTAREMNEVTGRLSEALDELAALAEKNQRLERRIAELEAMREAAAAEREQEERALAAALAAPPADAPAAMGDEAPPATPDASLLDAWKGWGVWHWVLFLSLLALAFALGGYAVDWSVRRRHGGFRI